MSGHPGLHSGWCSPIVVKGKGRYRRGFYSTWYTGTAVRPERRSGLPNMYPIHRLGKFGFPISRQAGHALMA